MIMKRLGCGITLFVLSVAVLWSWLHVEHGYCSQKNELQNEFQITEDSVHQQEEPKQKERSDKNQPLDPASTIEHQSEADTVLVDEQETHETGVQEENEKELPVARPLAESESDHDSESSILPEQDFISEDTNLSPIPAATASQPVDLSTATISLESVTCSDGDESCSSTSLSTDSPTAACDAAENPSYDSNLDSLPLTLENSSSPGTGRNTKPGLGRANQGTNASSMLKIQGGPAETDPSPPDKDAEDIPTFDEWKKIMMEEENEKSQSTHTSYSVASSTVKKVQKTTNYASVECGAKILSSNPEAKSTSAILMENVDVYMLNPCSNKIWFVIELCQPIQVKQLDIANFELFSSTPKDFLVSISDRYPTNKWSKLGTFHARDERTIQSFPLDEHLYAKYVKMFTKYIKVELLSHFGSEHFCPLSLIRIFGTSMMEEYELNSEPSERLTVQDEDDDYPPGYVPSDDKSSKNLIGSAKDAILKMVNNIAANMLGGNSEDGVHSGDNSSSPASNLTETSGATVLSGSSNIMTESLEVDEKVTGTISITQDKDMDQTISLPTTPLSDGVSVTSTLLILSPTTTVEEQIITLLPEEEEPDKLDQSEHSLNSISQQEKPIVMAEQYKQDSGLLENKNCCEHTPCSWSCFLSLEEYLLQICIPLQKGIRVELKSQVSQKIPVIMVEEISSLHTFHTSIMEPSSVAPVIMVPQVSEAEHGSEDASLELMPSLASTLVTFSLTDAFTSKATHSVDFLDPSSVEQLDTPFQEKSKENATGTPLLTPHVEPTSYSELTSTINQQKSEITAESTEETGLSPSAVTITSHLVSISPLTSSTDQPFAQPSESETAAQSATEPLVAIPAEPKIEDLQGDAALGGFGSSIQAGNSVNGQHSSSEFYAEMQSSTETPISGSNQKESVFMRLNNRIKALEVNMSLSGRYLEQLSQRYRKQMEEMQKAFNKTIIKLQNTSKMAEEQDQRQTESIQLLQRQLENMTHLILNLSVQVSQLQSEVSDRHSYLLLCVILCLLISVIIGTKFRRFSPDNPSLEQDTSSLNSYSYCCPDRSSSGYEELHPVRRASYPFSQSSVQTVPIKDLNKARNAEIARSSTGNKKKKRCKMKTSGKPETITSTTVSVSSVPNGGLPCNTHLSHNTDFHLPFCESEPFTSASNLKKSSSEGSPEESSQSDEPSFCGISTCVRLCEPLPPHKVRLKKKGRLKKRCTVMDQLLQPVKHNGPPVMPDFTMHGFIRGATEMKTNKTEVVQLSGKKAVLTDHW